MSGQITEEQLETMTAEQIAAATVRGELAHLLGGEQPDPYGVEQARAEWLAAKAAATEAEAKPGAVDHGARGRPRSGGQVTEAELATMSAEEIAKATAEGRMTDLLS
jgi:hypothetical protein